MIRCSERVDISQLQFSALHIAYSDGRADTVVQADASSDTQTMVDIGDGGSPITTQLTWTPGSILVLHGDLTADHESEVGVTGVKLLFSQRTWNIEIIFDCGQAHDWYTPKGSMIPAVELAGSVL